jgi:hypothetical protein
VGSIQKALLLVFATPLLPNYSDNNNTYVREALKEENYGGIWNNTWLGEELWSQWSALAIFVLN